MVDHPIAEPRLAAPGVPEHARRLGHLGLAPFVAGAVLTWLVNAEAHPYVALAMTSYAAVIIAFLGGLHWGLAMRHADPPASLFTWGVVTAVVAWLAAMMPANAGLVVHGVMLVACYAVDRRVYPREGLAHWLTLRFRLSALAALCCFLAAAGT